MSTLYAAAAQLDGDVLLCVLLMGGSWALAIVYFEKALPLDDGGMPIYHIVVMAVLCGVGAAVMIARPPFWVAVIASAALLIPAAFGFWVVQQVGRAFRRGEIRADERTAQKLLAHCKYSQNAYDILHRYAVEGEYGAYWLRDTQTGAESRHDTKTRAYNHAIRLLIQERDPEEFARLRQLRFKVMVGGVLLTLVVFAPFAALVLLMAAR